MGQPFEGIGDVLPHTTAHDPDMLAGVVDTTPTLEAWSSVPPILEDMQAVLGTMAAAYDAGVYSFGRQIRGVANHVDLPVGAAVYDPASGRIFQGFAQDKDLSDPQAHAEVQATDQALAYDVVLGSCTLAVTVEPCPSCLDELDDSGVSRVVYGASRAELEAIGLVKEHGDKAPDIVRTEREADGRYGFEFFQLPNRAVQAACLELFTPYVRNPATEHTELTKSGAVQARRFQAFAANMDGARQPQPQLPQAQGDEATILRTQFAQILNGFYR